MLWLGICASFNVAGNRKRSARIRPDTPPDSVRKATLGLLVPMPGGGGVAAAQGLEPVGLFGGHFGAMTEIR